METVKEYLRKMGKMPTLQYRFICPICGLNSNIEKLQRSIFIPKIYMRAYLGRAGIQFFEPEQLPEFVNEELKRFLILKCKELLSYYNDIGYPVSIGYLPTITHIDIKPNMEVDYGN